MSLQTKKVITRPRVTLCKMTSLVIESVENRAKKDGIKTLKFFNHKKETMLLTPVNLSTGVDSEDDDQDGSDDSDYLPSSDDESDFNKEYFPSVVYYDSSSDEEDNGDDDDPDDFDDGKRIAEALDQEDNVDVVADEETEKITEQDQ